MAETTGSARRFAVCVQNKGYEASLERNKIYVLLADPEAEKDGDIRVVDESGEDYHEFYKREIAPFKGTVELWYKRKKSFLLDMKIIFVTAWVVLFSGSKMADRTFPDLPKHHIFNP